MDQRIGERQTIWGGKVAIYFFVVGVAAGAYMVGVYAQFAGAEWDTILKIGVTVGSPLAAFSTLFLVWDLGRPYRFYRAAFHIRTSWISRGVIILTGFIIVGSVHLLLVWLEAPEGALRTLAVIGGALAFMTMIYTGLLLGVVRAIPFWSTPALPLLFLASALSTGLMAVTLITSIYVNVTDNLVEPETNLFAADAVLLAIEAMVALSYLYIVRSSLAAKASADSLLRGELSVLFWAGFVTCGLIVPLTLELILLGFLDDSGSVTRLAVTIAAVAPALLGGYILRHLVITAGVKAPLVVIGRFVPMPGRPRLV